MPGRTRIDPARLPARPSLGFERRCLRQGCRATAGLDEAGRGAWAGPVIAAAVILPPFDDRAGERRLLRALSGVRDSKLMTPAERDDWFEKIRAVALAIGVGGCGPGEVDADGLVPATCAAMERALACLPISPDHLLLDAVRLENVALPQTSLIKGDRRCLSIAAASVVAKVSRDRAMAKLDELVPGYNFARHKGYGTAAHQAALHALGPSPIHRRSYAPVEALIRIVLTYEVIIYWSEDDQAFIAEVPELPGCMADGATYQEALANVEVVIREWIETARELGRPIPEPKGRLMYA